MLRRWANWVLTEDRTPLKPTLDNTSEAASRAHESLHAATLADGHVPDSGDDSGEAARRKPGEPPRHWLELVRRAAPDLIRPAQDRMVTYRAVPPVPPLSGAEANPGDSTARSENSTSAPPGRLLLKDRPSFKDTTTSPLPVDSQHAHAPAGRASDATSESDWSSHARQPDSRHEQSERHSKTADAVAALLRETGREHRPTGNTPPSLFEETRATLHQRQATPYRAQQESAVPALLPDHSGEATGRPPEKLDEQNGPVRQPSIPIGTPAGPVSVPRTTAPASDVIPSFLTVVESGEPRNLFPTMVPSVAEPPNKGGQQIEGWNVRKARHAVSRLGVPEHKYEHWPELPVNSSSVPPRFPSTAMTPETGQATATLEPPSSTGRSPRAESRWPELLQESPSVVGEWEGALRSQQRAGQLDSEQRGSE